MSSKGRLERLELRDDMGLALLLSASLVLLVDQLTKALVAWRLAVGQAVRVGWGLKIRHVANIGRGHWLLYNRTVLVLLWPLALGGLIFVTQHGYFQHPAAQVGLGAALGGAASNLCDRLRCRAVIDFVDLGWWPVFNIADVAVTLGAIAALCFMR